MEKTKGKQVFILKNGQTVAKDTVDAIFYFVLPLLLVGALIATGVWGSAQKRRADELKQTNEHIYTQAFTELAGSVKDMNTALSKLLASNSNANLALTFDEIWKECGTITGLMGRIPQSHAENYELTRFLAKTGDYARRLSSSLMGGGSIEDRDREQLKSLLEAGERVYSRLSDRLSSGTIPLSALNSDGFFEFADTQEGGAEAEAYPTIDYDGPFSDSTENLEPKGLKGEEMGEEDARAAAVRYAGKGAAVVDANGKTGGKLPYYSFTLALENGNSAELAVTCVGGKLLYLREDTESGSGEEGADGMPKPDAKTLETLERVGKKYLKSNGFGDCEPTYARYFDGSVQISFVPLADIRSAEESAVSSENTTADELPRKSIKPNVLKVKLYPDTIVVSILASETRVVGVDAKNYLFNHTERSLDAGVIGGEEARKGLFASVASGVPSLALIPMEDNTERLCYEFPGSAIGRDYIVYIDAYTGEEVRILRLTEDENGTLIL